MNRREMAKITVAGTLATVATAVLSEGSAAQAADPEAASDIKTCCVCNLTKKDLIVHITSGYGAIQAFVKRESCFYFNFYDDKKKRILSAFERPNILVAHFALVPITNACLLIMTSAKELKTRQEKATPKDAVTTIPV